MVLALKYTYHLKYQKDNFSIIESTQFPSSSYDSDLINFVPKIRNLYWLKEIFLHVSKSQYFFSIWIVLIYKIWETFRHKLKTKTCSELSAVWINCSTDLKNVANSRPSALNFKKISGSLEQVFLTVDKNNFCNKIPFWGDKTNRRCQSSLIWVKTKADIEQTLSSLNVYSGKKSKKMVFLRNSFILFDYHEYNPYWSFAAFGSKNLWIGL